MTIFSELDSILASNVNDYMPKDAFRRNPSQGWNKEATSFLTSLGYEEKDITTFYRLLERHIHDDNVNQQMANFLMLLPNLVQDVSAFELEALKQRNIDILKDCENEIRKAKEELEEEIPTWMDKSLGNIEKETRKEKYNSALERFYTIKEHVKEPTVYRKGNLDKVILSWTDDFNGAKFWGKSSDVDYEYRLTPDKKYYVKELVEQNIYPVAGYGAFINFYEKEITFINLNKAKEIGQKS